MLNLCFRIHWDLRVMKCISMRPGHETSTHYFFMLKEGGAVSIKSASGYMTPNLCFCI
jgi:hypothetical protein